jgi:hypothetical protein
MRRVILMGVTTLSVVTLIYALEYVESSYGLEIPSPETGRTEVELVEIDHDGNINIISIGDRGSSHINTDK